MSASVLDNATKGLKMALTRKDAAATLLTLLAVLAFAATHEGWGVPLIGDSHRWAAGAIMLLASGACALGSRDEGFQSVTTKLCAVLGTVALVLAVLALATASLTPLSLLVCDIVALWVVTTVRHARRERPRPLLA